MEKSKEKEKKMKGYKAFERGLICKGKPGVWYMLKNGEFEEVLDDE